HAANAGGVWQTVVFGFAGVSMEEDGVVDIRPHMSKEWSGLSFRLHYRGAKLSITVTPDNQADVKLLEGSPVTVRVNGKVQVMGGTS
ncbi:MAG: glycosyl hydrolase family 65 protein, partial [Hungatella hathewayi]